MIYKQSLSAQNRGVATVAGCDVATLRFALQNDVPTAWYSVGNDTVHVATQYTGDDEPKGGAFLATLVSSRGTVFHLYDVTAIKGLPASSSHTTASPAQVKIHPDDLPPQGVAFMYTKKDGSTRPVVLSHTQFGVMGNRQTLGGYDHDRGEMRMFYLDKITQFHSVI